MSVRPLCPASHPALREKARPVTAFGEPLRRLLRDMIDTMYANHGIGLAAPQIGESLQLFVANPTQEAGRELVLANPSLESAAGRTGIVEGCLSLPNVWEQVKRSSRVRLRGCDPSGRPVVVEAEGMLAIVLQHEFDHLKGTLFIDRLPWYRRCGLSRHAGQLKAGGSRLKGKTHLQPPAWSLEQSVH